MIKKIITHPGGAHKDEFLACCVLLANDSVSILRQEVTDQELKDPQVVVVDVGHRHEPQLNNFDHHQFPRDAEPTCSLSLVLSKLGIYEDARSFCPWLEVAEWFDCRGPNDTADWLGLDREVVGKLNSPIDITILQGFAKQTEHNPGEPIWEVMQMIGKELVEYITGLRGRIDEVSKIEEVWKLKHGDEEFKVIFAPRTDPSIEEVSGALGWRVKELGLEDEVYVMVYPDGRGQGYGMKRFNDREEIDFSRIEKESDVRFAHARGFIAKVEAVGIDRLKELIMKSIV
ncbi:MAG: MYG1 family protein [Opitutales bacterium]|nr:MYG1 family protein [Opitutales bacterium]